MKLDGITGTYRLSPAVGQTFGATLLHLIARGDEVVGRYGRNGYLTGVLNGRVLTATFRDSLHTGTLIVAFNESLSSFGGSYTLTGEGVERVCTADRIARKRK